MTADLDKVKKAAEDLRKVGYNGIPILPKGAKYDAYVEPTDHTYTFVETIATGKVAGGLGRWRRWNDEKQKDDNCPIGKMFDTAYEKVKNKDKIKTLNYAIIHGNVSRCDMFTGRYDGEEEIYEPTGSVAFECDGQGADLLMETILQSDMRYKLLKSPRVRTPSGGLHLLIRYFIRVHKGEEIKLKTESLYQGEGHNEILLKATGAYTMVPPSEGYEWEQGDFAEIAALTMDELNDFINRLRRTDKRETKGALWTDAEQYQDITTNKEIEYDLISTGKTLKALYDKATKKNRRHNLALQYCGILKRYIKLNESDALKIIESLQPGDKKNLEVVETTYKKKDNQITSITTFRKLIIELVGSEEAANEIVCELMQHSLPVREFWSDKPDGKLLALAVDNVEECFYDQDKCAYAIIKDNKNDSYQIIKLKSDDFKLNLSRWFIDNNFGYEVARNDHKTEVINTLTSLISRKPISLENRSVLDRDENTLYYNLNNEQGHIWKITPDKDGKGATLVNQTPDLLLFRKLPDNHKQMTPAALDELDDGFDYLEDLCTGIKSESQKLVFKCWQIALFFNSVSYAAPCACGAERSGKSTAMKRAKSYYDPVEDLNNPVPRKRMDTLAHELKIDKFKLDDFNLMVWRSSLIVFDNISHFTPELEDECCLWITGGTHSKRKLYDDTEMIELSGSRALAYTGINNPATRPDHIARTFNLDFDIDANKKKTDEEIWTAHYDNKPKVLAYIGKIISKVLYNYDAFKRMIKVGNTLPDFEVLCEMISRCMGNPDNAFTDAWAEIRDEQVSQGLESSMVAIVLENWISENYSLACIDEKTVPRLELKPMEMYKEQKAHGIKKGLVKLDGDTQFPDTVESYTKELYRLIGSFKHIGIEIIKNKRTAKGRRIIVNYGNFRDRNTNFNPNEKDTHKIEATGKTNNDDMGGHEDYQDWDWLPEKPIKDKIKSV